MQALGGISLGRKFRFEALRYALEATLTHVPQHSVLAREITKESRLADFENLDDVIDAGFLVALFAEQSDGGLDNLLAKPRLFAFPKAWDLVVLHRVYLRWRISLHRASAIPASSPWG